MKQIDVTITSGDRKRAKCYHDNHCLLGTALRRMKFKRVEVYGFGQCLINGRTYNPQERFDCRLVCYARRYKAPFYKKSVIGMKVTLIPAQ